MPGIVIVYRSMKIDNIIMMMIVYPKPIGVCVCFLLYF